MIDKEQVTFILEKAIAESLTAVPENDGFEILDGLGIKTPSRLFVEGANEASRADLSRFYGDRVVVKAVSPLLLHKSDVGGIEVVDKDSASIATAIESMQRKLSGRGVTGFTINQFITYSPSLGNELLVDLRWTTDFGPVITVGAGGIYANFIAASFRPEMDVAILSTTLLDKESTGRALKQAAVVSLLTEPLRGSPPRLGLEHIVELIDKLRFFAAEFMPALVSECEINPVVVSGDELIALDVVIKPGTGISPAVDERPLWKIRNLLEPRSVAIIGVSEKLNPGHIIINNLIRDGFDRSRIHVVKQGCDFIEGCRCYADIGSLPERVDLFIASVSAAQTPGVLEEILERRSAESVIITAGGLEEKSGGGKLAASMRAMLARARREEWRGPVINGGNCLGIRSAPGRYDTMFIPEPKLPVPQTSVAPVAIISQSGAFAISRMSKLASVNPRYAITVGNQMDLTVSDYLCYLKGDPDVSVFAVYVEGFKPLDGANFLKAAREITSTGRTVIFYRAGRTLEGAKATSSHTASIAGDYRVACALARSAGVIVAESLEEFEDLTRTFALLGDRRVAGLRLAAVSNAGFECVAIADNLGGFKLVEFSARTRERIDEIFKRCRIEMVVDSHNPLDLTPMTDDAGYEEAIRAVMDDEMVEAGLIGCVPLTVALNTMSAGPLHKEDIQREDSVAMRMARLKDEIEKPWVAVIDAGAIYDPMAGLLEANNIPVFRTADRAARIFNIYCAEQLSRAGRAALSSATRAI